MRLVTGSQARAALAHRILGPAPAESSTGDAILFAHQRHGAEALRRLLERHGGALLADEAGLGKTFTALSVARGRQPLVLAPASLRGMWESAATRMDVGVHFASFESLSRGHVPGREAGVVVIDEAHHLRTRGTRRFAAAAQVCRRAPVLLLSATPVQNREDDLRTLLSLFLGARAYALSGAALSEFIVRHTAPHLFAVQPLPAVREPEWLPPVTDVECLDRLLELPPPVPPRDGADAAALVVYSLTRQWASSRAALAEALRRRLARGLALTDSLRARRMPSRAELAAWSYAEGVQQLSFAELLVAPVPAPDECAALIAQAEQHLGAVRELLNWLQVSPDPDAARISHLRALLGRHAGERMVAFSEFSDTVAAFFGRLVPDERVAMLTHTGGRVAAGPLTRRDVLDRFAPGAAHRFPEAERIQLLLATDVLSEGVGLHDASVLVHLDLAWNPARLEQRVGRLRRLGASRDEISVYLMRPPAGADRLLQMEQRLRRKLTHAARTVGLAGAILPDLDVDRQAAAAAREERIAARLRAWRTADAPLDPVAGAVAAPRAGAVVCVTRNGVPALVGVTGSHVSDARDFVEDLLAHADGADHDVTFDLVERVEGYVSNWLRRLDVGSVVSLPALHTARSRRSLLRRVDGIARRTPRHAQPRLAPLVHAVRAAATATLPAGAERVLEELTRAPMADHAWLQAVGQFAELHARGAPAPEPARIEAMLLLVPD
jgi:hypothetical protein